MEEKQLTERESLQLIQQMVSLAKKEQSDDGWGWILWGWMILLASMLTVANLKFHWLSTFFFWNLFGGFTVIYFLVEIIRQSFFHRPQKVKTYAGDLFTRLDAGFFMALMFIIVVINYGTRIIRARYGAFDPLIINMGFALLINLYAFWILVYGTALNFRPSIVGAYCAWIIGFAAIFANDFEVVMWLHALAALVGYIIPGIMANKEFRKTRKEEAESV